jgi:hypothetical protein
LFDRLDQLDGGSDLGGGCHNARVMPSTWTAEQAQDIKVSLLLFLQKKKNLLFFQKKKQKNFMSCAGGAAIGSAAFLLSKRGDQCTSGWRLIRGIAPRAII